MATKTRGAPYPLGSDPNDAQAWLSSLAQWVDDRPGVAALTTTARNALTGVDRWDGKLVLDTTLDRLFRWDAGATTWTQIADQAEIAALLATSGTPAALATAASRGVSSFAARADHVHAWPAPVDYVPAISSISGGTVAGRYVQLGKLVHFSARFTLGSGFAVGSAPAFSLPVAMSASSLYGNFSGTLEDNGSQTYIAAATNSGTGFAILYGHGTNGALFNLGPTTPFTWAIGDMIKVAGTYEAA